MVPAGTWRLMSPFVTARLVRTRVRPAATVVLATAVLAACSSTGDALELTAASQSVSPTASASPDGSPAPSASLTTSPTASPSTSPAASPSTSPSTSPTASPTAPPTAPGVEPPAAGALPAAPRRAGPLDFAPYTATFLGNSASDERAEAVAIGAGDAIVVGGSTSATLGTKPRNLLGGGVGSVVRLARTGGSVLSVTRLPARVEDLAVARRTGAVAAVGAFGLVVLDPTASTVAWRVAACPGGHADKSTGRRVDVADDGTVVVLCNGTVTAYGPTGRKLGSWGVKHQSVDDVAVDSVTKLVYATGGDNLGQLRVAVVEAYTYAGRARWKDWGWSRATIGPDVADTFGIRLSVGGDGRLYFLGGSAGGNSIFSRDAQRPTAKAANATTDMFDTPYNTSSNNILYLARLDASTGKHVAGKYLLARNSYKGNKGNTIEGRGIAADEKGRVFVVGKSAYAIEKRDSLTLCGTKVHAYAGDVFALQLSPDLRTRQVWAVTGAGGGAAAVAARDGVAAAVQSTSSSTAQTCRPLAGQAKAAPGTTDTTRDAYLTVWPAVQR